MANIKIYKRNYFTYLRFDKIRPLIANITYRDREVDHSTTMDAIVDLPKKDAKISEVKMNVLRVKMLICYPAPSGSVTLPPQDLLPCPLGICYPALSGPVTLPPQDARLRFADPVTYL